MLKSKKQKLTTLLTPVISEIIAENSAKRLNEERIDLETIKKIESLFPQPFLKTFQKTIATVGNKMIDNGFLKSDVVQYINSLIA